MKHATTDVILNHYLSRRITTDTQAVVSGLTPQEEIMQAAYRMSRWIDPNRPRALTAEQSLSVNQNPRIQKLLRRHKNCPTTLEYRELQRQIRNEKQSLRYAMMKDIRKSWDTEQAEKDIQQQISGGTFEEKISNDLRRNNIRAPEHNNLVTSIMSLLGKSLKEEIHRRSETINAVARYCQLEERRISKNQRVSCFKEDDGTQEVVSVDEQALEMARNAVYKEKRPRICFLCLGNIHLDTIERTHCFSTPGILSRHFKLKYLTKFTESGGVDCSLCKVHLEDKMALQRHAFDVHDTVF